MMTLIALAVEMIVNVFLVIRNAVIRLLPAPEFVVVTVRGPLPERRPVSPARLRRWLGRMWDTPPPESLERSEERRVGKECRSRWGADRYKRQYRTSTTSTET